jgi:hypothetical protein
MKLNPPISLYACIQESIKDNTITEKESIIITNYCDYEGGYWELHWGDIEEQNGMTEKEATVFENFYLKYKTHEVIKDKFKYILFKC